MQTARLRSIANLQRESAANLTAKPKALAPGGSRPSLGAQLVLAGALSRADLHRAESESQRQNVPLADVLLAHGLVSEGALLAAWSRQYNALPIDPDGAPPDPRLIDRLGMARCLDEQILPIKHLGGATLIATSRPQDFDRIRARLPAEFGTAVMMLSTRNGLTQALLSQRQTRLAAAAEATVTERESCRFWYNNRPRQIILAAGLCLMGGAVLFPVTTIAALTLWAVVTMLAATALKLVAAQRAWTHRHDRQGGDLPLFNARLPVVSILVPLFDETDIATRLIDRLGRLTYPRECLDVCLITEAADHRTRALLDETPLPHWMRVITVPDGQLRTKPRAMNFATDFCRGSIIGIYDAEDAPAPDQIHRIVQRFAQRGPEVACLQGVLDFYNTGTNWFSRCFTVEYATWFRLVLPGLERLRLAVPLGGTTVFFRREALEKLGRWDAHNVTEDADLGIRLARHGYRTELIDTITEEEANCRIWPWVRQRSRWLKGYAMTWSVHMRDPALLWRQLGPRAFVGFQVLFLGTLSQFLLAPVLWSFWLLVFGLPHPLVQALPGPVLSAMAVLFLACEAATLAISIMACRIAGKRRLLAWVPTLNFYYPLASLATYKAIVEMVAKPFYWDKTAHGVDAAGPDAAPDQSAASP